MKALFTTMLVLVGLAILGWQVAIRLSPDAIAMAVGMLFGVLACIPVSLLLMASDRRRDPEEDEAENAPAPAAYRQAQTPPMSTVTILSDEFSMMDMLAEVGGRVERLADGSIIHTEPSGRRVRMIDARGD